MAIGFTLAFYLNNKCHEVCSPLRIKKTFLESMISSAESDELMNYIGMRKFGTSVENSPTLVLNADYTPLSQIPLSIVHWQDALRAIFNGKATVVSEYNVNVRSVSVQLRLPSVIALKTFRKLPPSVPMITRRNVYIRDNFKCQYCLQTFSPGDLTLDHVVPKSRGGVLAWTNTVCACGKCNCKKGQTMPGDIHKLGMKLASTPRVPSSHELQSKAKAGRSSNLHPHWEYFL